MSDFKKMEKILEELEKLPPDAQAKVMVKSFPALFLKLKLFADNGAISHKEAMQKLQIFLNDWNIK